MSLMEALPTDAINLVMGKWIGLIKDSAKAWSEDKAPRLGAALAYYSVFSIAPLLLVVITVVGLIVGTETAETRIVGTVHELLGPQGAGIVRTMLDSARQPGTGIAAMAFGIVMLLLGAAGLVAQLKDALNTVWDVEPPPTRGLRQAVWRAVRRNLLSLAMVVGLGLLLIASLLINRVLAASEAALAWLPGAPFLWAAVNLLVTFGIVTMLFAAAFKLLPDTELTWGDVAVGALLTGILFMVGKELLGLYLGQQSYASAYGAASSLVIVLVWVYYSAQILLFGAEFTKVYARRYGSQVPPSSGLRVTRLPHEEPGVPRDRR